ncbi:hypothetical protein D3C71_2231120 [compost metagenome]
MHGARKKAARAGRGGFGSRRQARDQVFLLTVIVGNLALKSLALSAIFTAMSRAMRW